MSSGLSIHEHDEPTKSTFHIQSSPSDNAYDPTTSLTSNVAAAEDGSTHTLSKALSDKELCTAFVQKTCGCTKANGKPCSTLFPVEHYIQHRTQASLLTRQELDLVLLGSIMTTVLDRDSIVDGRHIPAKRRNCHHVTCIVDTVYAKVLTHFCMAWEQSTGLSPLKSTTLKMAWKPGSTRILGSYLIMLFPSQR